jgi:hypothetical protein
MTNYKTANKVGIDSAVYAQFKKEALDNALLRKQFALGTVKIESPEEVILGDKKFKMTEDAFYSFVRVLNLNKQIVRKFDNTLGEKATAAIMDIMKRAIAASGKTNTIVAVLNRNSQEIVDFRKNAQTVLSNDSMIKLFEDVMNTHSGMYIKNMSASKNGSLEISVLNDNWEFDLHKLPDEQFKSGLFFANMPSKSIITSFNERLVCLNGMVTTDKNMAITLESTDANSVRGFFDAVRDIKDVRFFETKIKESIGNTMDVVASYREVMDVHGLIFNEIAFDKGDMLQAANIYAMLDQYIPEKEIRAAYLSAGFDLQTNTSRWKQCQTNLTIWELVNTLTYAATHFQSRGISFKHDTASIFKLQKKAGELTFKGNYDLGTKIPNVY